MELIGGADHACYARLADGCASCLHAMPRRRAAARCTAEHRHHQTSARFDRRSSGGFTWSHIDRPYTLTMNCCVSPKGEFASISSGSLCTWCYETGFIQALLCQCRMQPCSQILQSFKKKSDAGTSSACRCCFASPKRAGLGGLHHCAVRRVKVSQR